MTAFIDKKLKKIKVPDALPSVNLWPLAIVMRPTSALAEWHLYAVAKGKNDALPLMALYSSTFQIGTWAVVDRQSGMVIEVWPVSAWIDEVHESSDSRES